MASSLRQAIEGFRQAQRERQKDVHDPARAAALRTARQELEQQLQLLLKRLPFSAYPVTPERHFAVREEVLLLEGPRRPGQTLCGAPSGHPPRGHPAPCTDCLLVAERFLIQGPPPLELGL